MRAVTVATAMLFLLAGCSSPDASQEAQDTTSDPTSGGNATADGNATMAPAGNATDAPPTVTLAADNTTVPIGATVTFTITALDADGDETTWTIDADGDGTQDGEGNGTTFQHAYSAAGQYVANVTASDSNATATATLAIEVIDVPAPADGTPYPATYSQEVLLSCPHCFSSDGTGEVGCLGLVTGENGFDCAWFELPADAVGHSFTIAGTFFPIWQATTACDGTDIVGLGVAATGAVPEGAGCLFVWDPVDPLVTVTLVIA